VRILTKVNPGFGRGDRECPAYVVQKIDRSEPRPVDDAAHILIEDHVEEHRTMRAGLVATPTSELRSVLANLRDHLASEERYFLSRRVLRDDLAG